SLPSIGRMRRRWPGCRRRSLPGRYRRRSTASSRRAPEWFGRSSATHTRAGQTRRSSSFMAAHSRPFPIPIAATWNISSATRSNCRERRLGYNSRPAPIPMRRPPRTGGSAARTAERPGRSPAAAGTKQRCDQETPAEYAMSNKGQMLQDPFLNTLRKEHVQVSIYLVNGIKLQGQIESFDQYVVLLKNTVTQMVYKHAISTVVPARSVAMPHHNHSAEAES